ncbi:MAG: transglutaminaseTgpA domain-containing protein, partial [Leptothrix sp. (in: b-proteobacteria)]
PQHGAAAHPSRAGSERDGVRAYRRGDALTQIAWKKSAQALTGGGELVSRDQPGAPQRTLQLRWTDTAELATHSVRPGQPTDPQTARLARLTAWLLAADRSGAPWSLELPGVHLPASRGDAQRSSALLALATWSLPDGLAPAGGLAQPAATDTADQAPPDPTPRWRPRPAGMPLPREARDTLFLLATLGWTLLPQFSRVPLWCSGFAVVALLWRGWLAWRAEPLPPRWLLVLALAAAAALTWQQHHSLIGKEAGVSLLVLLAALKTLELRAQRDHWVVFGLGFFLILANFLYSQSLATALAMLAAVLGLLSTLTLAHMPAGRPRLWRAARLASHQTLIGAPLVLLLFVFFPRVAPLWSVPGDTLARTGLSDRLRLGDVAELASDDSLALRVHFDAAVPPREALYFRGPVLVYNDGEQWRVDPTQSAGTDLGNDAAPAAAARPGSASFGYDMTIEPLRVHTLPLLELTLAAPQLEGATLTLRRWPDLQWTSTAPLAERLRVHAVAQLDVRWAGADQAPPALLMERLLPPGAHPRSVAWARALRATPEFAGASAEQLAQVLLRHIRSGGYAYTLSPGLAPDGDALDRFWLDRKEGFCEHYATAFVVLMRAMGVPARIVTGYQGGQFNPIDQVLEVRQSDAHAWAEYWQTGRGWVRIDPTAAVAPERVQQGRRLRSPPGLVAGRLVELSPALAEQLRALWGALDYRWSQWVTSHNQNRQLQLLRDLGWPEVDELALGRALLLGLAGLGLLGAGWAAWDARRNRPRLDPWLHAWQGLQRQLRQRGLPIEPHQPPRSVADSARTRWGNAAEPLAQALEDFEQWRYGVPSNRPAPLRQQVAVVRQALRQLSTRR